MTTQRKLFYSASIILLSAHLCSPSLVLASTKEKVSVAGKLAKKTARPVSTSAGSSTPTLTLGSLAWEQVAKGSSLKKDPSTQTFQLTTTAEKAAYQFTTPLPVKGIKRLRISFIGTLESGSFYIGVLNKKVRDWKPLADGTPLKNFNKEGKVATTFEVVVDGNDPLDLVIGNGFGGGVSKVNIEELAIKSIGDTTTDSMAAATKKNRSSRRKAKENK
jgi:hypothetical protein